MRNDWIAEPGAGCCLLMAGAAVAEPSSVAARVRIVLMYEGDMLLRSGRALMKKLGVRDSDL